MALKPPNLAARPICPLCLCYHVLWEPHGVTTIPEGVWEWPPGEWYWEKMKEKPVSQASLDFLRRHGVDTLERVTKTRSGTVKPQTLPVTETRAMLPVSVTKTPDSTTKPQTPDVTETSVTETSDVTETPSKTVTETPPKTVTKTLGVTETPPVTETPKGGRPKKLGVLSNTDRQRAYRQRRNGTS